MPTAASEFPGEKDVRPVRAMIFGKHKQELLDAKRLALVLACFIEDVGLKLALRSHFPHSDVADVPLFVLLQNVSAIERRSSGPVDPIMSRLTFGPRKDYLASVLETLIDEASQALYPVKLYDIRRLDGFSHRFLMEHFGDRCLRGQAYMRSLVIEAFLDSIDAHRKAQSKLWPFLAPDMPSPGITQNFIARIANLHGTELREKGDPDYAEFSPTPLCQCYDDDAQLARAVDGIFHDDFSSTYVAPTERETTA